MAESFITQCPHCGTSFRVRTEQLSVANGSVRCGACLQVFSARNHVVTGTIPPAKPAAKPTAQTRPPEPPIEEKAVIPQPPEAPEPKQPEPEFDEFLADEDESAEFLFEDEEEFVFSDGPDDKLFDEDEQDDGLGELSDSFLNIHSGAQEAQEPDLFQQESQLLDDSDFGEEDEADESWAESILEEMEKEEKTAAQKAAVFDVENPAPKPMIEVPESQPIPQMQSNSILGFDDEDFSIPTSASQVVNQASQEIELDFPLEERFQRLRPLGWLLIIILLVTLAGQMAWLQRDTFARMDQWRGIYVKACDVFNCTLPEQIDLEKIRTSVLVREHKDKGLTDIKVVDIILTNQAPFKQAFPTLILQFTDINGQLVADQTYYPETYLKGEMTGVELMPINTRIYIALPISKPAANAVNHQLLLSPAKID